MENQARLSSLALAPTVIAARVEAGELLARSLSEKIEQEYNDW